MSYGPPAGGWPEFNKKENPVKEDCPLVNGDRVSLVVTWIADWTDEGRTPGDLAQELGAILSAQGYPGVTVDVAE